MSDSQRQTWIERLSSRETEILSLIAEGLSNREIAQKLVLSPETIKWYNKQIYSKLGVNSRTQAVFKAQEYNLLDVKESQGGEKIETLSNLPTHLTSFIGREEEIEAIKQHLKSSRLVVLTGPGGSGKSRLALQVAGELTHSFRDGVWLVKLASLHDPVQVADATAQVLEVSSRGDLSPGENLKRYLVRKHLMLVLDNFEHLIGAAPWVGELLAAAPQLTILATSRESLQVYGEQEFQVEPLKLPDPEKAETTDEFQRYDAIQLFIERAEAFQPGFDLDEAQTSVVAQICHRLDGLPLAIELAAARTKIFTTQQLLDRLGSRLNMLTTGSRDAPARQRTLRNTIEWSYNLLDEDEQRMFKQLGIFSGGFSLESVEAICESGKSITPLVGLESLLNKSLIYKTKDLVGELRFSMLETIREYASERLAKSGEEAHFRNRHLDYFLDLAERAEGQLEGPEQVTWLNQLEIEHSNLRAALRWSRTSKDRAELGLRMTGSLAFFWQLRGYFREGREHLLSALSRKEASKQTAIHAKLLYEAGRMAYVQGDFLVSCELLNESISIYRDLGPEGQLNLAHGLVMLGDTETGVGNYTAAESSINEGLEIMRRLEDSYGIGRALWKLGWCMSRRGEYEQASQHFSESLSIYRQIGDKDGLAIVIAGLGEVHLHRGDYDQATSFLNESLELRRKTGDKWGIAASLGTLAWAALRRDETRQAEALLQESLTLRRELGDRGGVAWCLEKLAEIALTNGQGGNIPEPQEYFQKAAKLFGAAKGIRKPTHSVIDLADQPEYERQITDLKSRLDKTTYTAAWAEGEEMTMDQAVSFALDN